MSGKPLGFLRVARPEPLVASWSVEKGLTLVGEDEDVDGREVVIRNSLMFLRSGASSFTGAPVTADPCHSCAPLFRLSLSGPATIVESSPAQFL